MAPSAKVTLKMSHDNDAEQEEKSDWVSIKRFASNATTRNMLDLLLVTTIIVLLGIAAPVIRGDCKDNKLESQNNFKCDVRASCGSLDNRTSGKCVCHVGFTGDGHNCIDIDECSLGNNSCPAHAHCVNVVGSYACECFHGYHGNHCYDVDECELGIHLCDKHANCINTIGSYKCACQVGFHDDGNSCKDVNECKAGSHNCTQDARCLNTDGSYRCV